MLGFGPRDMCDEPRTTRNVREWLFGGAPDLADIDESLFQCERRIARKMQGFESEDRRPRASLSFSASGAWARPSDRAKSL